ncbi:MAG: glycoside hydrolase family 125 protein [Vulcanimicrobiaceae bacterium]
MRVAALVVFLVFVLCSPGAATHQLGRSPAFLNNGYVLVPLSGRRVKPLATTALFHTLFNDFATEPDGTTYVQTGDIPAMWLRDSSAQTIPYIRFQPFFPRLRERFAGVIERNARNILTDPYANAFTDRYHVWERKWEVDSLSFPIHLAWTYWQTTVDRSVFTPSLHAAFWRVVHTYRCERDHARCSPYRYDYPVNTAYNYAGGTGMLWCAFRPSDDAVRYRYNVPQEMLAVVAMRELVSLAWAGYKDAALSGAAADLAQSIEHGIQSYARFYDFRRGWTYVYETDGEGHSVREDDANLPNLTAIPYFAYRGARDPVYLNTRDFALSTNNPLYYRGRYASGLGSAHTPRGWVWPLGIAARGLTATSASETMSALTMLAETDSREFLIHESFDPNAYWRFTRAEFGWANAVYAELIFRSIAGFAPVPSAQPASAIADVPSDTPTLTSPVEQLENQGRIAATLARLLSMLH